MEQRLMVGPWRWIMQFNLQSYPISASWYIFWRYAAPPSTQRLASSRPKGTAGAETSKMGATITSWNFCWLNLVHATVSLIGRDDEQPQDHWENLWLDRSSFILVKHWRQVAKLSFSAVMNLKHDTWVCGKQILSHRNYQKTFQLNKQKKTIP